MDANANINTNTKTEIIMPHYIIITVDSNVSLCRGRIHTMYHVPCTKHHVSATADLLTHEDHARAARDALHGV